MAAFAAPEPSDRAARRRRRRNIRTCGDLFIGSLYARKNSEVELWPSQREAARRSTDVKDDLVVALPTSAGKTRVAEIAALMTLSSARRVLIVTPLRALSAQTERSFRKTFAPLGFSVSSLYGASGLSAGDEDALRSREIIIATPEKLDFALRSDPSLIDDVGLIVLDEGHMIGPSEREIRYETLVQRLLRRTDAADRRIVCLSAILPSGDELDDLTAWIRADEPGDAGAVRLAADTTAVRDAGLAGHGCTLRPSILTNNGPFLDKFVVQKPPRGREKKPYPRKNSHLALFAAWEFASQGKRTLIFSTQANWVEGYGKQVVDLCKRGYLDSLLDDEASIARALEVGKEWLGEDHPAVASLKAGRRHSPWPPAKPVLAGAGGPAVGRRPEGHRRIADAVAGPQSQRRGFAGPRAVSGGQDRSKARSLRMSPAAPVARSSMSKASSSMSCSIESTGGTENGEDWSPPPKARTLKSGLIQIVAEILERLSREGVLDRDDAWEYLANAREAWRSPEEEAAVAAQLAAGAEYRCRPMTTTMKRRWR